MFYISISGDPRNLVPRTLIIHKLHRRINWRIIIGASTQTQWPTGDQCRIAVSEKDQDLLSCNAVVKASHILRDTIEKPERMPVFHRWCRTRGGHGRPQASRERLADGRRAVN